MTLSVPGIIYQALIQSASAPNGWTECSWAECSWTECSWTVCSCMMLMATRLGNCQAILGGDASIDVVSQLDAQTFTWQIHAVKTDGAQRTNMLTGQGSTLQAAFEDLHDRTALAMDHVYSSASRGSTPSPPSSSSSSPYSLTPTTSCCCLPRNDDHGHAAPPTKCKPAKTRHDGVAAGANIRLHLRWSGFKDVHFAVVCAPTSRAIQDAVQQLMTTRRAHEFGPVPPHKLQGAHHVQVRKAGFSDGQVRAATDAGGGLVAAVKKAQRAARRRRVHMVTLDDVWVDMRPTSHGVLDE